LNHSGADPQQISKEENIVKRKGAIILAGIFHPDYFRIRPGLQAFGRGSPARLPPE
jgi:hypothetical protein